MNQYSSIKLLRKGLFLSSIFCLLSLMAILLIDKSLALFIHNNGWNNKLWFFKYISEYQYIAVLSIGLLFIIFNENILFINKITLIIYTLILVGIANLIKTLLKVIFGRYWPETWHNNLSLINNNIFGFNWLHGFNNNGSFPSGHLTFVSVISFTILIIYPKFKSLAFLFIISMLLAQVILNYHFLGDTLAGISLGCLCSYLGLSFIFKISKYFDILKKL